MRMGDLLCTSDELNGGGVGVIVALRPTNIRFVCAALAQHIVFISTNSTRLVVIRMHL